MPANCRAKRPGASARRPGNACRTGERERESGGAAEEEDKFSAEPGALDLGVPAADLAAAFAFEQQAPGRQQPNPTLERAPKGKQYGARQQDKELRANMVTDRFCFGKTSAHEVSQ